MTDQRANGPSNDIQTPNFYIHNGVANPNSRIENGTSKKRSISASRNGPLDLRLKSHGPIEDEIDSRTKNSAELSYYINSKRKSNLEHEEFPKIDRSPLRASKRIADSSHLSAQYSNSEKLPSVEDKKKRVSVLEDYVTRVYGRPAGKTGSNLATEERRSESQDRGGGNLRKKLYATKGTGNQSVLSDILDSTTNAKSVDKEASFVTENSELAEKEMNPEEIHYFFVSNIQKSRNMLSRAEQ